MSYPIQLITIGTPADHYSVAEISGYLVSCAAGRKVVALLHLGEYHDDLWRAAEALGWEPRECFSVPQGNQASFLSACLGEVFCFIESASRFPGNAGMCAMVVVAYFELTDPDLLLLRLICKIESSCLEVCAQMGV